MTMLARSLDDQGKVIATDHLSASVPAISDEYIVNFKQDMKSFMRGILGLQGGRTGHMVKYDYCSLAPENRKDSGADLWERVVLHSDMRTYYIPPSEGQVVDRNRTYFANMFSRQPVVIDLGPGDTHAVKLKSWPTYNSVNGSSYTSVDINPDFSEQAAQYIARKSGGKSTSVHADFTKMPALQNITPPILLMMYGCTLSQFPLTSHAEKGETTLKQLLTSLGNLTSNKAIMIATIDTNPHGPSAVDCYSGQHFREFKLNFWNTAKTLIEHNSSDAKNYVCINGDSTADFSSAFIYAPDFVPGVGIRHRYVSTAPIAVCIDGERYEIPAGVPAVTGYSQKSSEASVIEDTQGTGWSVIDSLSDGQSTIRALVFAGNELLNTQAGQEMLGQGIQKTQAQLKSTRGRANGSATGVLGGLRGGRPGSRQQALQALPA